MKKTAVQRWGNSLALRIPKAVADQTGVKEGTTVEMKVQRGALVIRAVRRKRPALADLVDQIAPGNLHREIGTGKPVGGEAW